MNLSYSIDTKYWLALAYSVTDTTFFALLNHFKDPEIILKTPLNDLAAKTGLARHRLLIQPDWKLIDEQLQILKQNNIHLVSWIDKNYPERLRQINRPPPILFVMGNIKALNSLQLAVVGARKPSLGGIDIARMLARSLGKAGLSITSGLALGIDKAAHEGALEGFAPTIAVLGSGLDIIYPYAHKTLAKQIIEKGGALVSEFLPGTAPKAAHFPQRNRIISGMSLGSLVIEATLKSGSLITARYALEQNREVFAVPGSIYNPLSAGCHQLLKKGAKLVETTEDVLEELRMIIPSFEKTVMSERVDNAQTMPHHLDREDRKILTCLTFDTITAIDQIIEYTGLSAEIVTTRLLTMELNRQVASVSGGYLRKNNK